jgi:hypothetical protein
LTEAEQVLFCGDINTDNSQVTDTMYMGHEIRVYEDGSLNYSCLDDVWLPFFSEDEFFVFLQED